MRMVAIVEALKVYRADTGHYPSEAEGLSALRASAGHGPYVVEEDILLDPWGHPFLYELSADGVPMVTCLGADGKRGGDGENADTTMSF